MRTEKEVRRQKSEVGRAGRREELLALGMFGPGSRLGERIEMLLARGREFSGRASVTRVAMSTAAMAGFVMAGSIAPRWIAFAKPAPPALEAVRFKLTDSQPGGVALAVVPRVKGIVRQLPEKSAPKAAAAREFEVVSVRAAQPGQGRGRGGNGPYAFRTDPGMLGATNITLKELFRQAYGLKEYQLTGGPDWLTSATYDVSGKASAQSTREEIMVMLRGVLAERFQLKFHIENKPLDVMAIVVAKGGPKFHLAEGPDPTNQGNLGSAGSFGMSPGFFQKRSLEMLANMLSGTCGTLEIPFGPVVDMTGLKGEYDLRTQTRPNPESGGPRTLNDQYCEALPQLGLEFQRQKVPMDTYVIDSAERVPAGN